jgi:hypothetical protein
MQMNRRGILQAALGMVALPAAGPKAAAAMLGVGLNTNDPMPIETVNDVGPSTEGSYWGSPLQIAMDTKRDARHRLHEGEYAHMKSWGRGFRLSVIEREQQALRIVEHKMQRDTDFAAKIFRALGGAA